MTKPPKQENKAAHIFWAALSIPVMWLALIAGGYADEKMQIGKFLSYFAAAVNEPFNIRITPYSGKTVLASLALYAFFIAAYYSSKGNRRPGEEHGSAKWGEPAKLRAKYSDKKRKSENIILILFFNRKPAIFVVFFPYRHVVVLDGRKPVRVLRLAERKKSSQI